MPMAVEAMTPTAEPYNGENITPFIGDESGKFPKPKAVHLVDIDQMPKGIDWQKAFELISKTGVVILPSFQSKLGRLKQPGAIRRIELS